MAVTAVWAAVLITYGVSTGTAMGPVLNGVLQLNMAPNSVDDMYHGCKDKMRSKVQKYLWDEKNTDKNFNWAWHEAEKYNPNTLGKEQAMAIYVYSLEKPNIYEDFNNAVRTQKFMYQTKFRYHALHFFLTDALQTLKAHKKKRCLTGYRGVNKFFSQDVLNKEIRFGSFTSSSRAGYSVAKKFGDKSCFEIKTCFGADITSYSKFKNEAEVLIPPYEVFKVKKIIKRSEHKNLPCEVVYRLRSTGVLSNLNCALFPK